MLGWFFRLFNKTFDAANRGYTWIVQRLIRFALISLAVYAGLLVLTGVGFKVIPTGFIPTQDQGYVFCVAQLPDGASLQRTDAVRKEISDMARKVPGVGYTVEITGLSALDFTNRSNTLTMFLPLKPFDERKGTPGANDERRPGQGAGPGRRDTGCVRAGGAAAARAGHRQRGGVPSSSWKTSGPPGCRRWRKRQTR